MNDQHSNKSDVILCISKSEAFIKTVDEMLNDREFVVLRVLGFHSFQEDEKFKVQHSKVADVFKPGFPLFDLITRQHPSIIIVDISEDSSVWGAWVALIKSDPATRRIPLLCLVSENYPNGVTDAYRYKADLAVTYHDFYKDASHWLDKLLYKSAYPIENDYCSEGISSKALEGIRLFNEGEYFEAHELLEEAWNEDPSAGSDVYRAILQISVAYYQVTRKNFNGALKIFLRARQWIDPLPDECRGIQIGKLRSEADEVYKHMLEIGKANISEFDRSMLKPIDCRYLDS